MIEEYAGEPAVQHFIDFCQRMDAFVDAEYDKEYLVFESSPYVIFGFSLAAIKY